MTTPTYIGIDVGKDELVVATPTDVIGTFPNDRDGHRGLVERLRPLAVARVVLEATGCYGRAVAEALVAAGFTVCIVRPGLVRHHAKSRGVRAKTDEMDARVIASFGRQNELRAWTPPTAQTARLRALVDRRDQIVDTRKREENHLTSCTDPVIAKEISKTIKRLEKEQRSYDRKIAEHIAADEHLRCLSEALQNESGVGLHTAAAMLAYCPELGSVNRQQIAALVGFAPYNDDSGKREGTRVIAGGRRRLRRALYMAAISACRWNAWLKPMYDRLRARGKPAKVALVACGRKLAIRLNTLAIATLAKLAAATQAPT